MTNRLPSLETIRSVLANDLSHRLNLDGSHAGGNELGRSISDIAIVTFEVVAQAFIGLPAVRLSPQTDSVRTTDDVSPTTAPEMVTTPTHAD